MSIGPADKPVVIEHVRTVSSLQEKQSQAQASSNLADGSMKLETFAKVGSIITAHVAANGWQVAQASGTTAVDTNIAHTAAVTIAVQNYRNNTGNPAAQIEVLNKITDPAVKQNTESVLDALEALKLINDGRAQLKFLESLKTNPVVHSVTLATKDTAVVTQIPASSLPNQNQASQPTYERTPRRRGWSPIPGILNIGGGREERQEVRREPRNPEAKVVKPGVSHPVAQVTLTPAQLKVQEAAHNVSDMAEVLAQQIVTQAGLNKFAGHSNETSRASITMLPEYHNWANDRRVGSDFAVSFLLNSAAIDPNLTTLRIPLNKLSTTNLSEGFALGLRTLNEDLVNNWIKPEVDKAKAAAKASKPAAEYAKAAEKELQNKETVVKAALDKARDQYTGMLIGEYSQLGSNVVSSASDVMATSPTAEPARIVVLKLTAAWFGADIAKLAYDTWKKEEGLAKVAPDLSKLSATDKALVQITSHLMEKGKIPASKAQIDDAVTMLTSGDKEKTTFNNAMKGIGLGIGKGVAGVFYDSSGSGDSPGQNLIRGVSGGHNWKINK